MDHPKDTPNTGALQAPPIRWWQSRTIIAALITVVASLLRIFEVEIHGLEPELTEAVFELVTLIGGAVAAEGRISATRRVGSAAQVEAGKVEVEAQKKAEAGGRIMLLLLVCLLVSGCAGYKFTGSLSAEHGGQTVTVTSDGKTINTDVRLASPKGYAK